MVLPLALLANAVDLEGVAGCHVSVFAPDLLFELAHFRRKEFNGTAAGCAHHVMMAAAVVLVLITSDSVVKSNLAGQAAFGQQLEGAIHGRISDARVLFLHQAVEFVGGKMIAGIEEGAQDGIALSGLLQAHSLEVAMKNFFGLANHLTGKAGLIVNAFLQHENQGRIDPPAPDGAPGRPMGPSLHPARKIQNITAILKMKFIFRTLEPCPGIQSNIPHEFRR